MATSNLSRRSFRSKIIIARLQSYRVEAQRPVPPRVVLFRNYPSKAAAMNPRRVSVAANYGPREMFEAFRQR
jgi:hypothetical protein